MLDEGEVDWSSSDTGIVSLEPTGSRSARAVANGPGMAAIEVTHGEVRAGSTIDVENLATGLREVTGSDQEGAAGEVLPEEPSPPTAFTFARPAALGGSELALYVRKIDG